eukprot:6229637-Prymnesium_polylepis.1
MKSFVGPAILYLPHAFDNGGLLASAITMPLLGVLCVVSFTSLAQLHVRAAGYPSYGDLAALALGTP